MIYSFNTNSFGQEINKNQYLEDYHSLRGSHIVARNTQYKRNGEGMEWRMWQTVKYWQFLYCFLKILIMKKIYLDSEGKILALQGRWYKKEQMDLTKWHIDASYQDLAHQLPSFIFDLDHDLLSISCIGFQTHSLMILLLGILMRPALVPRLWFMNGTSSICLFKI